MAKATNNSPWQFLPTAAKRLGRNPGHLRKLCPALVEQGFARKVRVKGRRRSWQIHRDFSMPAAPLEATGVGPIVVSVNGITIRINAASTVTLQISPDGCGDEALQPSFDRALKGPRTAPTDKGTGVRATS